MQTSSFLAALLAGVTGMGAGLVFILAAGAASVGCNGQGEGDFCVQNSDCASGLECVQANGLSTSLTNRQRCCPTPPAQPSTPACMAPLADGGLPTEVLIDAGADGGDAATPDAAPLPDASDAAPE